MKANLVSIYVFVRCLHFVEKMYSWVNCMLNGQLFPLSTPFSGGFDSNLLTRRVIKYAVVLDAPLEYSLDDCIEYIQEDELVEVTPLSIRMCKNPKLAKKGR